MNNDFIYTTQILVCYWDFTDIFCWDVLMKFKETLLLIKYNEYKLISITEYE